MHSQEIASSFSCPHISTEIFYVGEGGRGRGGGDGSARSKKIKEFEENFARSKKGFLNVCNGRFRCRVKTVEITEKSHKF